MGFECYQELKSYTEGFKELNNVFQSYAFCPLEGRIFVFPAHLAHQVEPNQSNEDRISISFNIWLKETIHITLT